MLRALGDFVGGELSYWPYDNTRRPLSTLTESGRVTLDAKTNTVLLDGRRGHEVANFEGEHHSLVFFTHGEEHQVR